MKALSLRSIVFGLITAVMVQSCGDGDGGGDMSPAGINVPAGSAHEWLSDYNFFLGDMADLNPNTEAGILPYDLNNPLFSDYAKKKRFIYVPDGQQIDYVAEGTLNLPVGSVLIKHFYYGQDDYVETRLLIRKANGWQPETYIWNDDLSDAKRTVLGGSQQMNIDVNGEETVFTYKIPNQNECKNCHAMNGDINPIGPKVANLNKSYSYSSGSMNQIDKWVAEGMMSSPSGNIPSWPAVTDLSAPIADRAKAYLDSNCSSCHRREGSAANSGLYLEFENTDELSSGIWKTPVAAGDGSGGLKYVIHPGNAEESILWYRINSSEVEVRMPELGRELIHAEGVDLIRDWINSMD